MSTGADIGWAADPHLPQGEWSATTRFGLRPAPHGLALVEDFLNTGADPSRDQLADVARTQAWSARAAHAWSLERGATVRPPVLADGDDAGLRDLRDRLGAVVSGRGTPAAVCGDLGTAAFTLSAEGEFLWRPTGSGWRWWAAAICAEVLSSQHCRTWTRLKQCHDDTCRVVFYDRSWNNGTVLHAGHTSATEQLAMAALG